MQAAILNELTLREGSTSIAVSYDASTEVAEALQNSGVPEFVVGKMSARIGGRFGRVLAQPLNAVGLLKFCKRHKIDLVYEVMGHPLQVLPRWLTRRSGVLFLTSVHDAVRHLGEENRLLAMLNNIDQRDTDGIVTYSNAVADAILPLTVPFFRTVHGAFGGPLRSMARKLPCNTVVIGFFGRIEPYKGLRRLADSAQLLSDTPGTNLRVHIVGRGEIDSVTRQKLEQLRARIDNRWISEHEIASIIENFDVMALPYDEASQSGVLGFAMRAGVPLVVTPVGGLGEQVRTAGGMVATGMSSAEFADAIRSVITSESLYESISANQLKAAREVFSWSRVAQDVWHAAWTLVSSQSSRRPFIENT